MNINDKINLRAALKVALPTFSFLRKEDMVNTVSFFYADLTAGELVGLYYKRKVRPLF